MEFIISDILVFTFAVFLLLVTPGPGVLSTAGVGSGFGSRAGLVYLIGLFLGTNLVALAVVGGYAALVLSIPYVRWVLMAGSFGYLLWLALKIAMAGRKLSWIESEKPPGIHGGILLQAIFSGFPFEGISLFQETLWKFLIFNLVWIPIHFLWLFAGVTLNRMNLSERHQFLINSGMSVAMVGVVVLAALAQ